MEFQFQKRMKDMPSTEESIPFKQEVGAIVIPADVGAGSCREAEIALPAQDADEHTPPENVGIEQEAANQNQTAGTEEVEDPNCPICRVDVDRDAQGIICEMCHTWLHRACLFMPEETFQALSNSSESWFCAICQSIRANKINGEQWTVKLLSKL